MSPAKLLTYITLIIGLKNLSRTACTLFRHFKFHMENFTNRKTGVHLFCQRLVRSQKLVTQIIVTLTPKSRIQSYYNFYHLPSKKGIQHKQASQNTILKHSDKKVLTMQITIRKHFQVPNDIDCLGGYYIELLKSYNIIKSGLRCLRITTKFIRKVI